MKYKTQLLELIGTALNACADVRLYAKEMNLLNSQDYLNFEDELNRFSVKDPNE